ncbi:hypothetical protein EIP86_000928 [Pleurotus ostreatoroseus]|nr:hypothetical protein EIP86_000928 [Pleurotus ostreatoroseus]
MSIRPYDVRLRTLRKTIVHRPPYCSGVVTVPDEELVVFYGKNEDSTGRIDFKDASERSLTSLAQICDPATFGRNDEDIFDESYRRAGKLDKSAFSVNLDLEKSGLMEIIRTDLLEGKKADKPIHAELYKLNVYGPGSFFKSHKDTPRGETMFGSLVIVYPTVHEGGALIFRDGDKQWTFDSAEMVAAKAPALAYAAFFSDLDHEVIPVRAGYRVTVTYNLYFPNLATPNAIPPSVSVPFAFKSELERMLADPTFLPDGGVLGFGFRRVYPVMKNPIVKVPLDYLKPYLKGNDANILHACDDLGLTSSIWAVYRDTFTVALSAVPSYIGTVEDYDISRYLYQRRGAKRINSIHLSRSLDSDKEEDEEDDPSPASDCDEDEDGDECWPIDFHVQWVTKPSAYNVLSESY